MNNEIENTENNDNMRENDTTYSENVINEKKMNVDITDMIKNCKYYSFICIIRQFIRMFSYIFIGIEFLIFEIFSFRVFKVLLKYFSTVFCLVALVKVFNNDRKLEKSFALDYLTNTFNNLSNSTNSSFFKSIEEKSRYYFRSLQEYISTNTIPVLTNQKLKELIGIDFFKELRNNSYIGYLNTETDINNNKVYSLFFYQPRLINTNFFRLEFIILIQNFERWIYFSSYQSYHSAYQIDIFDSFENLESENKTIGTSSIDIQNQAIYFSEFSKYNLVLSQLTYVDMHLDVKYDFNNSKVSSINSINAKIKPPSKYEINANEIIDLKVPYPINYSFTLKPEIDNSDKKDYIVNKINNFCNILVCISFLMMIFYKKLNDQIINDRFIAKRVRTLL